MTGSPLARAAAVLLVLVPATASAEGLVGLDLDEPSGATGDRTRISIGYQTGHSEGNVDSDGNPRPGADTNTRTLLLAVDHRFADRWSLHVSLPYVVKRAVGDPGVHNPRFLAVPRDSDFIDDGDYPGAWQDWQAGVTYHGAWKGLAVRPHAVLTWPSHEYTFFASAAPGRYLRRLRLGADVSRRFGRSNVHWSAGYSYEFVEKVLDRNLDKHHYRLSAHWDLSPTWSLNAFANARTSNGLDPAELAGKVPWSELWYQHDRMLKQDYALGGVGATWHFRDRWALSAATAWPLKAEGMHRIRQGWDFQVSRSF